MNTKDNNSNLPQNLSRVKPAAIWARVSTHDQRETSIPSQIDRCEALLEQEGFTASHTLCADWASLDLFSCPEFQELRSLIKNRDIEALAVFDRDRLEAKGLQRLMFLSECKENAVKLIICQGPPILDEPEGQIVELALALGKERSVLRARQGSRDGLRDRALKRRLPTSRHKLYGYRWETERRLVPDDNWPNVKLIFDMLLADSTYWPIIQELKKRSILSPQGLPEWNKAAISNIVHNPAYTGRYYALKKWAIEPVKRKGNTYGNSSQKKLALDEWHYIPEIEIVDPPITWDQCLQILDQLSKHQKLAQRSATRDYLLRGMIFCETHRGKKGEPRCYHGQPHQNSWRYTCPVGGCDYQYLNGLKLEDWVKNKVMTILFVDTSVYNDVIIDRNRKERTEKSLRQELSRLDGKYNKLVNLEAELEHRNLLGTIDEEVYQRLKAKYRAERQWVKDREQAINDELLQLDRQTDAIASLDRLANVFLDRLDNLTIAEWRQLFSVLNLEIHVRAVTKDTPKISSSEWLDPMWDADADFVEDKNVASLIYDGVLELQLGLPLNSSGVAKVVSKGPEPD